jgi:hypothetical protein
MEQSKRAREKDMRLEFRITMSAMTEYLSIVLNQDETGDGGVICKVIKAIPYLESDTICCRIVPSRGAHGVA